MIERGMTTSLHSFTSLDDKDLLARLEALAQDERTATATLIAALVELETRRLYAAQRYKSLFEYCTEVLRLSDDAAYNRIRAVRVAAKWPEVLDMLVDGSLSITVVRLL